MLTTLEERVAYLEGKVEEHSDSWQDLRERITHMEQTFSQRFLRKNKDRGMGSNLKNTL